MRTCNGVVHIETMFLRRKRVGDVVRSARMPRVNVRTARERPIMVRY